MAPGVYVFGASPKASGRSSTDLARDLDGLLSKLHQAGHGN
jgi:hypothetical protein